MSRVLKLMKTTDLASGRRPHPVIHLRDEMEADRAVKAEWLRWHGLNHLELKYPYCGDKPNTNWFFSLKKHNSSTEALKCQNIFLTTHILHYTVHTYKLVWIQVFLWCHICFYLPAHTQNDTVWTENSKTKTFPFQYKATIRDEWGVRVYLYHGK